MYGTQAMKTKASQINFEMRGTDLKEVDSYKYLGTTLDATLKTGQQLSGLNQTLAPIKITVCTHGDFMILPNWKIRPTVP